MTTVQRVEPATKADERELLEGFLDYHRATLSMKCQGLDDVQLRTASVPGCDLTLLGLVRHLADVERHWFQDVLTGGKTPPHFFTEQDPDGDFHPGPHATRASDFPVWQDEVAKASAATSGLSLDTVSVGMSSTHEHFTLRWIYLHMIEEYARHNGHADLLRQKLDGATGE